MRLTGSQDEAYEDYEDVVPKVDRLALGDFQYVLYKVFRLDIVRKQEFFR